MTSGPVGFHHVQIAMPAGEESKAEAFAAKAHPALLVEGWQELRARLRDAGAAVVDDDLRIDGRRRFYAFDPFRNRLELIEAEPGPTPER